MRILPLKHGLDDSPSNTLESLTGSAGSLLVFSMEDEKCRAYNEFFAERILNILTQEQTGKKRDDLLADLVPLGVKVA